MGTTQVGLPGSSSIKGSGLGEPFGKASLANTASGLGRFISMRDMGLWTGGACSVIPLKSGLMKPGRGVCPGLWRRKGKTGGGQERPSLRKD